MTAQDQRRIVALLGIAIIAIILWIALDSCHAQSFLYSPGTTSVSSSLGDLSGDAAWKELSVRSRGHPWSIEYRHIFHTRLQGSTVLTEETEIGGTKWTTGQLQRETFWSGNGVTVMYAPPRTPITLGVGWQQFHGGQLLTGTDSEKKWREVDLTERKSSAIASIRLQSAWRPMGTSAYRYSMDQPFTSGFAQYQIGSNISRFSGGFRIWTRPLDMRLGYLWTRLKINDISIRHSGPYVELGVVW